MFIENDMNTSRITSLMCCFLLLVGCATGSHILTGKAKPAIDPINVKLYLKAPGEYETIGIVEASSDVELSTQAAQDRAIQELKKQAALIGANGVLITNTDNKSDVSGHYSGGVFYTSTTETKTARGEAIFVHQ